VTVIVMYIFLTIYSHVLRSVYADVVPNPNSIANSKTCPYQTDPVIHRYAEMLNPRNLLKSFI
jgi:hypothetical protein